MTTAAPRSRRRPLWPNQRPSRAALLGTLASLIWATLGSPCAAENLESAGEAAHRAPWPITEQREPCADYDPLRQAFFGDLHVHTGLSHDASTQGTRHGPREAYRFAIGEELGIQPYTDDDKPLRSLQLDRPLDFAAVTDHGELLGEMHICKTKSHPQYGALMCRIYRRWPKAAFFLISSRALSSKNPKRFGFCDDEGRVCLDAARNPWQEILDAAEEAYDRTSTCTFTSFVGYEHTGAPMGRNLHRNVIFRNDKVPDLPISYVEEPTPEGLWDALTRECLETNEGCDVLTIPHNSNLSGGLMFETVDRHGDAIDKAYAAKRAQFEPLVEIMQHKGDSECLPGAWTQDELCGFEKLPYGTFAGRYVSFMIEDARRGDFVREVLKDGLAKEATLGANPFQYGIIASTDTHLGTPGAADENRFLGHGGAGNSARTEIPPGLPDSIEFNPGGLAGLWAEENSRDALFEAMRRREAFGTSGPRIPVRLFGGWDYPTGLCGSPGFVRTGYERGVPMGGTLPERTEQDRHTAPTLAVWALRDPGTDQAPGSMLDKVQIVKGWVDRTGETFEKVYDVALARIPGGIDETTCSTPTGGARSLCSVWVDEDFDPGVPAFYYARVLETPTCRWSARLCNQAGVQCEDPATIGEGFEACCEPEHRRIIRERAWTSPIWYSPPGS